MIIFVRDMGRRNLKKKVHQVEKISKIQNIRVMSFTINCIENCA